MTGLALLATALLGTTDAAGAQEAPDEMTWGAEALMYDKYAWRGLVVDGGANVQPSAWIASHGFTTCVWATAPLARPGLSEIDLIATWDGTAGGLDLTPGATVYVIPEASSGWTAELSLDATAWAGPVSLTLQQAVDVQAAIGSWWGRFLVGTELDPTDALYLEVHAGPSAATSTFNDYNGGVDKGGIDTIHGDLALYVYVSDAVAFVGRAEADTWILEPAPHDGLVWTAGLGVSWEGGR